MKRCEQKREDVWNLTAMYASDEEWCRKLAEVREQIQAFSQKDGSNVKDAGSFLTLLDEFASVQRTAEHVYTYASLKYNQDTGDAVYQQLHGEAEKMLVRLMGSMSWLEPWILDQDKELLESWMKEEPKLSPYRRFIYDIRRRRIHMLDAEKEKMLSLAGEIGQAPSRIFSMLQNADLTFEPVTDADGNVLPLTQTTFTHLEKSEDRKVRKDAFEHLYGSYRKLGNTFGALYDSMAAGSAYFAAQHKYESTRGARLDASEIPETVYDALLTAVEDSLPLMHRYVRLRKKLLGVDELHMYDVYVPIVKVPEHKYTFEEAKEIVLEGLAPMGEKYLSVFRSGFEQGWIDKYENEGKRGGAFSSGCYDSYPYVLLNFKGSLNDVFTLAHEMGHSVHSWFTRHNQPYMTGDYRIFVAEVASTCNEALLIRSLLEKTDDPQEKRYLINYLLEQFKSTLYRQTMFARFEDTTHKKADWGESMNAAKLCEIYLDLNKKYFGPDMISDPEIAWEWARIPHFYTPFYVYQYATGFSAAIAISEKIWNREEGFMDKYIQFLSGGSSTDPISLLKICDVDMTSPEPVSRAIKMFEEYLEMLEKA